jgi:hypothetical protein
MIKTPSKRGIEQNFGSFTFNEQAVKCFSWRTWIGKEMKTLSHTWWYTPTISAVEDEAGALHI